MYFTDKFLFVSDQAIESIDHIGILGLVTALSVAAILLGFFSLIFGLQPGEAILDVKM